MIFEETFKNPEHQGADFETSENHAVVLGSISYNCAQNWISKQVDTPLGQKFPDVAVVWIFSIE